MPDNTNIYFARYFNLKEDIDKSKKNGTFKQDFPGSTESGLIITEAVQCMGDAYIDNYTLTIEHICKVLNLEERQTKNSILPCLDYILAPNYAGKFFSTSYSQDLPFWERRLMKWKKLFINRDSFKRFILDNMRMEIKSTETLISEAGEETLKTTVISQPITESLAEGLVSKQVKAYRKCNLKDFVLEQKLTNFIEKTIKDIRYWQGQQSIGSKPEAEIRADNEIALLHKLTAQDLDLKAHDKEITDFIENTLHALLILDIGDKAPIKLYVLEYENYI